MPVKYKGHPDNKEYVWYKYWEKEAELWAIETREELLEAKKNYYIFCQEAEKSAR